MNLIGLSMDCHSIIVLFFVSSLCLMEHEYRYHNGRQASPFCERGGMGLSTLAEISSYLYKDILWYGILFHELKFTGC